MLLPSSVVLWAQAPDRAIWRRAPINCLALRGGPHKLDRAPPSKSRASWNTEPILWQTSYRSLQHASITKCASTQLS